LPGGTDAHVDINFFQQGLSTVGYKERILLCVCICHLSGPLSN